MLRFAYPFFVAVLSLFFIPSFAQEFVSKKLITTYYDHNWKETNSLYARYYSVARNMDSGWYRGDYFASTKKFQMVGLYEDQENKIPNGSFRWYHGNGRLKEIGKYVHGKKEGLFLEFYQDGSLKDSTVFRNGRPLGVSAGWHQNGAASHVLKMDSLGNGIFTSWFDSDQPSSAGRYIAFNVPHGRWQFFHKNGKVSSVELYSLGTLKDKQYFTEDGSPLSDTSFRDHDAEYPGGEKAWSKFLSKNLYFPSHLDFENGYTALVIVAITINEEGKIGNAEVTLPLHPDFDKIVLEAVKSSPKWKPASDHNRNVSQTRLELVRFSRNPVVE
jgi:antitoxin component YwqK of YwqJK toxin-antitoxin module